MGPQDRLATLSAIVTWNFDTYFVTYQNAMDSIHTVDHVLAYVWYMCAYICSV